MVEVQDQRILAQLQKEGRATNQELAEAVGMSTSACWRRVRALEESGWNVSGAARSLGMERTNLHKRIRALGLTRAKH